MSDLRVVIPPTYKFPVMEALNASFISQTDNVHVGAAQFDILDYLTADTVMYVNAMGAERKPFVYQERTGLEVEILDDPASVAFHNAILVLARQRFVFAYGEPRRSVAHTWS